MSKPILFALPLVLVAAALSATPLMAQPAGDAEAGKQKFAAQCSYCHGDKGEGGGPIPDLTKSAIVMDDESGKKLAEFLKVGRPDSGMPPFPTTEDEARNMEAFIRSQGG